METSEARRDSRLACSSRQGNDPRPPTSWLSEGRSTVCACSARFARNLRRQKHPGMRRLAWRTFWVFPIALASQRSSVSNPRSVAPELKEAIGRSRETIGHVVSTQLQPWYSLRPHEYLLRGIGGRKRAGPSEDTLAITVATASRIVVAYGRNQRRLPAGTPHVRWQHPRPQRPFKPSWARLKRSSVRSQLHLGHGPRHDQRRVVEVRLVKSNRRIPAGDQTRRASRLPSGFWETLAGAPAPPRTPQVQVKLFERESVYYLLARSRPAPPKRNGRSAAASVAAWRPISRKLGGSGRCGKLKKRDKIVERVGRLKRQTSESPRLRRNQRDSDKTAPAGMDVGPSRKYKRQAASGWGLLVTKQPTWLDGRPNSGKRIFNSRSLNVPGFQSPQE